MPSGLNRVMLLGDLSADPEVYVTRSGAEDALPDGASRRDPRPRARPPAQALPVNESLPFR